MKKARNIKRLPQKGGTARNEKTSNGRGGRQGEGMKEHDECQSNGSNVDEDDIDAMVCVTTTS